MELAELVQRRGGGGVAGDDEQLRSLRSRADPQARARTPATRPERASPYGKRARVAEVDEVLVRQRDEALVQDREPTEARVENRDRKAFGVGRWHAALMVTERSGRRGRRCKDAARRVRVLVVTNMYPSPAKPAFGSFVRDQVEALRRSRGSSSSCSPSTRAVRRHTCERRRRPAPPPRGASASTSCTLTTASAAWVALACGGPHVVTFHGTDLAHPVVGPLPRAARPPYRRCPRRSRLRSPATGCPGSAGRSPCCPCGVNLDRFAPVERSAARRALDLEPDGRYLLFPADPRGAEKRHDRARRSRQAPGARAAHVSRCGVPIGCRC